MPNTYNKIASVAVGVAGAATMDFSSIPGTYTDLLLKITTRDTAATANTGAVKVTVNASATTYTNRNVRGAGTGTPTSSSAVTTYIDAGLGSTMPTAGNTASTFSNIEIYITNYAGSTNKSFSVDAVGENNATAAYAGTLAGLWSTTSAITAISIAATTLFSQYSTATLYGISNT